MTAEPAHDDMADDWVPLAQAPFYCYRAGYITSERKWAEVLRAQVEKYASTPDDLPLKPPTPYPVEWSFTATGESAYVAALGILTTISPGSVHVHPGIEPFDWDFDRWSITGRSDDVLKQTEWRKISPDEQSGAAWHRRLLGHLFSDWHYHFVDAIRSGAAYLMARKNSVLSPHERIAWDQWQFFTLDDPPKNDSEIWHDPRESKWMRQFPSSATAVGGERLYSIYVAPGRASESKSIISAEDKCLQWLRELLGDYPDRPPKPLRCLANEAKTKFAGLSKNAFHRCYFRLQAESGNRNWSRPGAPKKTRR
jgi:hypothetical protein